LYRIGPLGQKETILDDAAAVTDTALSATGAMIAVVDKDTLKLVNLHTKESKFIYKAVDGSIKNHRWSPDEDSLLFTASDDDSSKSTIFVAHISSHTVRKLVPGTIGSWSPDGREIAYTKETGGIFIADSEGGKEQQILPGMRVLDLKRSPWGIKIAFIATPDAEGSSTSSLYAINKDGTELKRIAAGCSTFSWSPDGQSIVFEKEERQGSNIYSVSVRDANPVSIAKDANSPRFSPDSKRIAFIKDDGIYVANLDGSDAIHVLPEPDLALDGWSRSIDGQ